VTSGRTRLLPADGPLGVISAPRNSRGLPESRSRESRPTTRRPREPHRRNSGWRHPPPSGSPSGPVGPSGRNSNPDFPVQPRRPLGAKRNLEGSQGRVKAMFPLARRLYPAQDGRTTAMEFPVMSRASAARPGVHRFLAPPQAPWRACSRPGPGAPLQAASRLRPHGAAPPAPPPTPVPRRALPAYEPCHRGWNRTLAPSSGEDLRPWWPTARYRQGRRGPRPVRSTVHGPGARSVRPGAGVA
jgi:hypothetical protein